MNIGQQGVPRAIYRVLPFVYMGVGLFTIVMLQNAVALVSGLLLVSAGALVLLLRQRSRHALAQSVKRAAEPCTLEDDGEASAPLFQVSWRKAFECGHPVIDAQHRHLFVLCNEVINAVLSRQSDVDIEWLIEELIDHISDHFCTEEALLAKTRHPLSSEHQDVHRALLTKAKDLHRRFRDHQVLAAELVGFIACDIITDHITKDDLKFAPRKA